MLAAAARRPLLPVVLEILGLAERAELGVVAHEAQAHQAGGAVAVLRDLELDDALGGRVAGVFVEAVSYTHLRAHETDSYLVCRLLLEKKKHEALSVKNGLRI